MSKYFEDREIECKCGCGEADMDSVFMERLDMLRYRYNRPIILNSAFRCLEHNVVVGGVADSPHTKGIAVDIRCTTQEAYWLMKYAIELRFQGIGVAQRGAKRFIHLDDSDKEIRPNMWSY
tara:strand:- start:126 stop:488 length:363 start_codon:yes stop_codon:yes gene_type:complete